MNGYTIHGKERNRRLRHPSCGSFVSGDTEIAPKSAGVGYADTNFLCVVCGGRSMIDMRRWHKPLRSFRPPQRSCKESGRKVARRTTAA